MKLKLYIIAFLLTSFASAQVTFEAKVSKKKLGMNERLRIDFVMNKDGDNFNPPSFENFMVVGGPSQSINNSWINGVRTYSKTYSYFLAPKKRGKFTIGQSTIEIEGDTYKTLPLTIEVTAAIDKPKDPNDPNYIASKNIHLVAEVSKTNPYLNEAITVVYKLYISPNTGVDTWREIDNPRYVDFWSQNIDVKELKLVNSTYNGEDYRYVVLRKVVLYPQKTGKLDIEPLSLDIKVRVPTNRRNIFGDREMKSVHRTVSAGSRTINVKPLPEAGRPLDFSGAVGNFDFKVTTNKDELKATEALQARVEVSGKGNLKLFDLPKLTLPSSLEVYEPEHKENVSTNLSGMRGSISDSYTIVPTYQGKYPIPSVSFSYFDIDANSYKTITSNELIIDVNEGPLNTSNSKVSTGKTNATKQPVSQNTNQFLSFKTSTNFVSQAPSYFFKTKLFWMLMLVPFLVIPIAIFIRKKSDERRSDIIGNKIRTANKLARKYLGEAKKVLGNKEAFYDAMERALHNYLKSKLRIETSEFSKDKIEELLSSKNVDNKVIAKFMELLTSCELARYTPFTNVEMQQDYDKAAHVISAIDKQAR
jgi:predicted house-cleaning noncanonical NTP pyrophosphatase (MazG superfamily)